MSKRYDRTAALIGADGVTRLKNAKLAVIGLGGVGGAAAETLARCGVGRLVLVDGDVFDETNLNRQILCTEADIGKNKAAVAKSRVNAVDSSITVDAIGEFVSESNVRAVISGCDYVIDAIDDLQNKVGLILACKAAGTPVVSAMGAGNRTDCGFEITDLFRTKNDPFARAMRRALKGRIDGLDVVCATAPPLVRAGTPASIAAPPFVMGAMLANHAVTRIVGI